MRIIGLTGTIAAGKTTTAALFARAGVPVHDADRTVHDLYRGAATPAIEAVFPGTVRDGIVDRDRLADRVVGHHAALNRLEAIVHPLVRQEENRFISQAQRMGYRYAVLDVPLLFEAGKEHSVDVIITVTAEPDILRARALARPGMTEDKLRALLARQLPDSEKRRRAHFLIDTSAGKAAATRRVAAILRALAASR